MDINIILDISINVVSILLAIYILYIFFFKYFDKEKLKESDTIIEKLNNYTLNNDNILYTGSEKSITYESNCHIWTLNKGVSLQKSERLSKKINIFLLKLSLSYGVDYSKRLSVFDNFLREFGIGIVSINKRSLIIITNSGSKVITLTRIILCDLIDNNLLLIIEKNNKSIVIKHGRNEIMKLYEVLEQVLRTNLVLKEQVLFTLNSINKLISSQIMFRIVKVRMRESVLNTRVQNISSLVAQLLLYYINYGTELEYDDILLSQSQFTYKNGNVIKEQIKIDNYYINMSKFLKNSTKIECLCNIFTKANIPPKTIIIEVIYE